MMGLTAIALFTATALIARNLRVVDAYTARQADNERREARGLPPKHAHAAAPRSTTSPPPRTPPNPARTPRPTTSQHIRQPGDDHTSTPPTTNSTQPPLNTRRPPFAAHTTNPRHPPTRPHARAGLDPSDANVNIRRGQT